MNFIFPQALPLDSPTDLWRIQTQLLNKAEILLGAKSDFIICQPTFRNLGETPDVPQVYFATTCKGVYARLSTIAANYWPTTVYELAHETIHFLNPVIGYTNYFEEGIAVLFAESIAILTGHPMTDNITAYRDSASMLQQLNYDPFVAAKLVRQSYGALSDVEPDFFQKLCGLAKLQAENLCKKCIPG